MIYRQSLDVSHDNFGFLGYADSDYTPDYGSDYDNYKSTTGWIFTVNNVAISWRSRKQSLLADSTSAAELMAATDASKHNVWLRRLFADLGFPQHQPTPIFEDNESCIKLSRNYCAHNRVKHIDLREMLIREHHRRNLTELVPVPTVSQLADPLTKTLSGPVVREFRDWALRGRLPAGAADYAA